MLQLREMVEMAESCTDNGEQQNIGKSGHHQGELHKEAQDGQSQNDVAEICWGETERPGIDLPLGNNQQRSKELSEMEIFSRGHMCHPRH